MNDVECLLYIDGFAGVHHTRYACRFSQTCNHIAALLFKIESAFRLDMSNPACTTTACSWSAPASKVPVFLRLEEKSFTKPMYKKGKGMYAHNSNLRND